MKKDKSSYHHGDLRKALLDAGEQLLADEGLKGFTLRACARRAAVSHAAPKHHFGDVRGLLTAIAVRGFERLARRLKRALSRAESLEAEFLATTQAYVGFAEKYPEHFRIMFRSDLLDKDSVLLRAAADKTLLEMTNVILRQTGRREITDRLTDDRPIELIIDDIVIGWCHVHGFAHLKLEQQLNMVPASSHQRLMQRSAERLSHLLQAGAQGTSVEPTS